MKKIMIIAMFALATCSSKTVLSQKRTICIVGGTPSTDKILASLPDSLKEKYHLIAFNRPGYGGTENAAMTDELLFQLAKNAGLREHDYGVIGVSGGGPLAILLASKFKLQHCGVISGMVSKEAFFKFADSAVTKGLMESVLMGEAKFSEAAKKFPNIDEIVRQAGSINQQTAIKAAYDDLSFILSETLYKCIKNKKLKIDWWHGEQDVNVPFKSAAYFLKDYKHAKLNIIPNASHDIDSRIYIGKIIENWKKAQ